MGVGWEHVHRFFWDGGSSFDAWLNIASTKIARTLVALPYSWAQAGLPSALIAQLIHLLMGWWTGYMINILYLKHKRVTNTLHGDHKVQLHDVLAGLLGNRWRAIALFLNIGTLFLLSVTEFVSSSSLIFYINNRFNKQTWTLIFGGIYFLSIFIPSAHNYRALSFIGVISTIYIAVYLFIVGITHDKVRAHRPLAPQSFSEYFVQVTIFIGLGTEFIPVELMNAMWRPEAYKLPWFYGMIYTAVVSLLPTVSIYWRFGDRFMYQPNVLLLLPKTIYRDTALVLLLIHQFIVFGIFILPVYVVFEKMFRVHNASNFAKRVLVRIPVFFIIWLAALAFPFFSITSPAFICVFAATGFYILPCGAYMLTFWKAASHSNTAEKPFTSSLRWEAIFSINLGIILWMIAMAGLGFCADIKAFAKEAKHFTLFDKCYHC